MKLDEVSYYSLWSHDTMILTQEEDHEVNGDDEQPDRLLITIFSPSFLSFLLRDAESRG